MQLVYNWYNMSRRCVMTVFYIYGHLNTKTWIRTKWTFALMTFVMVILFQIFVTRNVSQNNRYRTFHTVDSIPLLQKRRYSDDSMTRSPNTRINNHISASAYRHLERSHHGDDREQSLPNGQNNTELAVSKNTPGHQGNNPKQVVSVQKRSLQEYAARNELSGYLTENSTLPKPHQFSRGTGCSWVDVDYASRSVKTQLGRYLVDSQEVVKQRKYLVSNPLEVKGHIPFVKEFLNPCFIQELTVTDPYREVSQDRRLTSEDKDCAKEIYTPRVQHFHENLRLRCFPYFFLAGVDSGDLVHVLPLHPQITQLSLHNINWWNRGRFGETQTENAITIEGYLEVFNVQAENILHAKSSDTTKTKFKHALVTGDHSPGLLWDQGFWRLMPENRDKDEPEVLVPHLIAKLIPGAKFLLVLRNPTERLYSDWLSSANLHTKGNKPHLAFHQRVLQAIDWMNNCTATKSLRACFYNPLLNNPYKADSLGKMDPWWHPVGRLRIGMYYIFIKDLLQVFPRNQVMIIRLEDFYQDRARWLSTIYKFLDLDAFPEITSLMKEKSVENDDKHAPMLPQTRVLLDHFYSTYNRQLAHLLGQKAYLYTTTTSSSETTE